MPTSLNPLDWAQDSANDAASSAVTAVMSMFESALSSAFSKVLTETLSFLNNSSTVDLSSGWWGSERSAAILGSVSILAVSLLLLFLLIAVIQGIMAGDALSIVRTVAVEVPVSIMGMAMLLGVTAVLLEATDAASAAVLQSAPTDLMAFFSRVSSPDVSAATGGLLSGLCVVVALIACLFLWMELVIRSSLIYLLLAFAPLFLAARVWQPARGGFRKLCHLGLALIFSKFAIALALGLGAAAVAGGGESSGNQGEQLGSQLSSLLTGSSLLLLAAFTPFIVLRLIPVVEASTVAHGISRSPMRGAQSIAQTAAGSGSGVARLAGGSAAGSMSSSSAKPSLALQSGLASSGASVGKPTSTSPATPVGFSALASSSPARQSGGQKHG